MIDELLDRLDKVRSTGKDKWVACCPVHGDRNPSMRVSEKDGRVLCHCFACGANGLDVVKALALPASVLFEKPLEQGYIPKRMVEEIELDRLVVRMAEEDKKRGKPLSYNDFNRLRVAKNRIMAYEERFSEQNSLNKMYTASAR
jgi:hypothetical protein